MEHFMPPLIWHITPMRLTYNTHQESLWSFFSKFCPFKIFVSFSFEINCILHQYWYHKNQQYQPSHCIYILSSVAFFSANVFSRFSFIIFTGFHYYHYNPQFNVLIFQSERLQYWAGDNRLCLSRVSETKN